MTRARWLELVEAVPEEMAVDEIVLHGPPIAETEDDLNRQTYSLVKKYWSVGARIIAENLGGNRFKVEVENVKRFRIYLSREMGDLGKPFAVDLGKGRKVELMAEPVAGERDYTARLSVDVPAVSN